MTPEEARERRQKELAAIKAANEMLEEAKATVLSKDDVTDAENIIKQIETAQNENLQRAKNVYQASAEEVNNLQYNNVSAEGVKKYQERLKRKGLSDEILHRKALIGSTVSEEQNGVTKVTRNVVGVSKVEDVPTENKKEETTPKKRKTKKVSPKTVELKFDVEDNNTDTITDNDIEKLETPQEISNKIKQNSDVDIKNVTDEEFDFRDIPSYVQFDIIPLPSHGECYKHHKSRLPVAYLTASDENVIASPNIYRDGNLLDVILERKILDKTIKASELCSGDRDAIILWLRATSYGSNFPIVTTEPKSGKKYETEVDLSKVKYKPFNLKSDEDGLFEYKMNNGDVLKFKYLTAKEEETIRQELRMTTQQSNALHIYRNALNIIETTSRFELPNNLHNDIKESAQSIADAIDEIGKDLTNDNLVVPIVTRYMKAHTVSINGNTDREFVDAYIDNMRAGDARKYRDYIFDNTPGIDLSVKIDIPETDGGGSFNTFLRIDDTIFFNT